MGCTESKLPIEEHLHHFWSVLPINYTEALSIPNLLHNNKHETKEVVLDKFMNHFLFPHVEETTTRSHTVIKKHWEDHANELEFFYLSFIPFCIQSKYEFIHSAYRIIEHFKGVEEAEKAVKKDGKILKDVFLRMMLTYTNLITLQAFDVLVKKYKLTDDVVTKKVKKAYNKKSQTEYITQYITSDYEIDLFADRYIDLKILDDHFEDFLQDVIRERLVQNRNLDEMTAEPEVEDNRNKYPQEEKKETELDKP